MLAQPCAVDRARSRGRTARSRQLRISSGNYSHRQFLGLNFCNCRRSCLTDETRTKEPVIDDWSVTTVGDITFFFLCDLFTDSSWQRSTIDGMVNGTTLEAEYPHAPASDTRRSLGYRWAATPESHPRPGNFLDLPHRFAVPDFGPQGNAGFPEGKAPESAFHSLAAWCSKSVPKVHQNGAKGDLLLSESRCPELV